MEYFDLTHDMEEGMSTFGAHWHTRFSISQLGRIEVEGRETRKVIFGTHAGTHADAPLHFVRNGASIDTIPLTKLIGPVVILDFSHLKENEAVTAKALESAINALHNLDKGDTKLVQSRGSRIEIKKIIVKLGWDKYWNTDKFYKDYPYFSPDAVKLLIDLGVELVGMDTPSPDDSRIKLVEGVLGTEADSPMHKLFLRNGVVIVEYLANLSKLSEYNNWNIGVFPLRIKGADGSPARVVLFR